MLLRQLNPCGAANLAPRIPYARSAPHASLACRRLASKIGGGMANPAAAIGSHAWGRAPDPTLMFIERALLNPVKVKKIRGNDRSANVDMEERGLLQ